MQFKTRHLFSSWFFASLGFIACGAQAQDGAALFQNHCARCHESVEGGRIPSRALLGKLEPEQIVTALEKGAMSAMGAERSRAERHALAQFLTGKRYVGVSPISKSAYCAKDDTQFSKAAAGPTWNGWGVDTDNTRFQNAAAAQRVHREYPVILPLEGNRVFEGVIDLAYFDGDRWTVVDFKTDAGLGAKRKAYERQLQWYAHALQVIHGTPVRAVLLAL